MTQAPPRRIVVLGTGGTIAGTSATPGANLGYTAGTVAVGSLLGDIEVPAGFALHAEQVAQLDSKDMDFGTWDALRRRCEYWAGQDDVAALLVTHGTDTIEETAYFLHCVLRSSKPVVMTCAMRPSTAIAPDGPQNLRDALAVATAPGATGIAVVCAGVVHGALDVSKAHPYRLDAFSSGDAGPLAYVEESRVRQLRSWVAPSSLAAAAFDPGHLSEAGAWPRVDIFMSHAGTRAEVLEMLLENRRHGRLPGIDGVVLAATGNGTLHAALEAVAARAVLEGVEVLVSSRCAEGWIVDENPRFPVATGLSPVKARIALMLKIARTPGTAVQRELPHPRTI